METPGPERRHAAYHEAGHVIADLVFGFRFTSVTIRPGEAGEYEGGVYGMARGRARDLAVVELAGIVASARMDGYDPWQEPPRYDDDSADIASAGDFVDNWAAFLEKTYGEPAVRDQLWSEAEEETRALVDRHWDEIGAIAGSLLDRETLPYHEVIAILKDRCPAFEPGGRSDSGR